MDVEDIVPKVRQSLDVLKCSGTSTSSDEQVLNDIFEYIKDSQNLEEKVRLGWLLEHFRKIKSELGDFIGLKIAMAPSGLNHLILDLRASLEMIKYK